MQDFEKLGLFYLGRRYQHGGRPPARRSGALRSARPGHPRGCVGMTGSGKTGLCLSSSKRPPSTAFRSWPSTRRATSEPAADVPALRRVSLPGSTKTRRVARVRPPPRCRRRGGTVASRAGGMGRGRGPNRAPEECRRVPIYTPGSRAGVPVSILSSFNAPAPAARTDSEAMAERPPARPRASFPRRPRAPPGAANTRSSPPLRRRMG